MKLVANKSLLLLLVLLLFLCSCDNQKENDPDPVTPPPIENPQPQPVVPDPDEWTPEELNAIEEFKNQPKNEWGYDDLAIYTVEGKVIVSALDSIDGGMIPSIRYNKKSITYRGVKPGDDAIETFQRLDIPKGAIYPSCFT